MTFKLLWTIVYQAWIASEVLLLIVTRTRRGTGETRDRGSLLILWPTILGAIWCSMAYGGSHPHTIGSGHWLLPVSFALLVLGLAIRWTAILTLGRAFSVNVAIHATQTVKKTGVFRFVRHPSYTGMMVSLFGLALSTRNWIAFAILILPTTAALLYRIHVEEAALLDAFGSDYAAYSLATSRLIPGIY
jgi:protein-S-isoprenylcysteine O-methyltransferase Ste14